MILVEPHNVGEEPVAVRSLTYTERRSVIDHLLGRASAPVELLQQAHACGLWIACDCGDRSAPPLLHTRQSQAGTLSVVRMPGRPPHTPGCPVAEGMTDLYQGSDLVGALAAEMLERAKSAAATRLWAAKYDPAPPSIWGTLGRLARAVPSSPVSAGAVVTHPNRLSSLAVKLRQDALATKLPQTATAIIAARSVDRAGITPLARDEPAIIVRGPNVSYPSEAAAGPFLAILLIARGTDGRYEPIASVSMAVERQRAALIPTPLALQLAPVLTSLGSHLYREHRLKVDIDLEYGRAIGPEPAVIIRPLAGPELLLGIGKPAGHGQALYVLPESERSPSLQATSAYADHLARIVSRRLSPGSSDPVL